MYAHSGRFDNWAWVKDAHLTERSADYNESFLAMAVYAEWRRYWDLNKPMLLEKSPRHAMFVDHIQYLRSSNW